MYKPSTEEVRSSGYTDALNDCKTIVETEFDTFLSSASAEGVLIVEEIFHSIQEKLNEIS
tara:strand:+ start:785 stop:964 length:180 start_codon:yes stop_codon:yes gene_type:complete